MYATALFIDGDNIGINDINFTLLFNKIKSENKLIINRVYGDWKLEQMNNFWNNNIIDHGLEEIQITRLAGKNSTDNKIIVDAMDCLYNLKHIDKFILLGCDKDYIPLIRHIRQENKIFECFGLKNQVSLSLINSCTIYHDIYDYINQYNTYDPNNIDYPNNIDDTNNIDDEQFILLNEIITLKKGISISRLKKEIKEREKKNLFGREFNNIDVLIKNKFYEYFDIKKINDRFIIYRLI